MAAKITAFMNQKGGVGKTTTTVNVGSIIAREHGKRVLLVDLDPQANLSDHLGLDPNHTEQSIYDVLIDGVDPRVVIRRVHGLEVLPANLDLAGAEVELALMDRRETRFRDALAGVVDQYDHILMDCPPSLGLLTLSGLVAAHSVVVAMEAEYLALRGISQLIRTVSRVADALNPGLAIAGVIFCRYDPRTTLAREVKAEVETHLPGKVYATAVRQNVRLAEAPSRGLPIIEYEPKSSGAADYRLIAEEFLARAGDAPADEVEVDFQDDILAQTPVSPEGGAGLLAAAAEMGAVTLMYPVVVAIDLETTGPDPYKDRIIEVGALVIEDGVPGDEFSELINPGVPLSPGIIKLTGITPAMLRDARDAASVLEEFLEFLPEGAICIAHNASFDRQFLRVATKDRFRHTVLDTVELSRICFPDLPSHSLAVLSEIFGIRNEKSSHRALADCETLAQVWDHILAKAEEIPLAAIGAMNRLLEANARHPYREFFSRLAARKLSEGLGAETEFARLFRQRVVAPPRPPPDGDEQYNGVDAARVREWFGPGGAFARSFPGYESRKGQVDMAVMVSEALNDGEHLMVEAGTGIGKSLAYLAPALAFAVENETPVVVSTNTKNLQSQLFDKDLPLIRKALDIDFKAALLKGRRNYLCLRKLFYLLDQSDAELDGEDRMRLLNIIPWAVWTETGDISENIVGGRPHFAPLWGKLSTVGDECMGRKCRQFKTCFLWKARAEAQAADLVVANHSLIFAELGSKSPALPDYRHLIFDEAHNLEDAATNHLSVELTQFRVATAVHRLHRAGRKGATGLMSSLEKCFATAEGTMPEMVGAAQAHIDAVREATEKSLEAIEPFFLALEAVLASKKAGECARFSAADKRPELWDQVDQTQKILFAELAGILHGLEALATIIRELDEEETLPYQSEFLRDLLASAQWIREITEDAVFVLEASNADYVFWLERAGSKPGHVRAMAAPVVVGPLLFDQLYQKKRSVIFCSATLTVKNKFDFLARRLGISLIPPDKLKTLNAGTPYDYRKQCMVAALVFLPEPGEKDGNYAEELAIFLTEVYRRTEGRGMALFTSYDMLSKVADIMEQEFLGDGITLLAQGRSGSRENITAVFKRGNRSVLLGTHSFWEGVDIAGDALSCLTIARLPFGVQLDPIIAARCEQVEREGGNAFMEYSLPSAVIRFRQGFGRLIRSRTDRGVAIIADRRVAVKRYGQWFRESIPAYTENFSDREKLLDAIVDFLESPKP